jgi:hypothetical protein
MMPLCTSNAHPRDLYSINCLNTSLFKYNLWRHLAISWFIGLIGSVGNQFANKVSMGSGKSIFFANINKFS